MSDVMDLDQVAEDMGLPLVVRFRGKEYKLGNSALGLLQVAGLADELGGDEATAGIKVLPKAMALLCPELPLEDLTSGEEIALVRAMTEVLNRIGRLSFQEEDAGQPAS